MPRMKITRSQEETHETSPAGVKAGTWVRFVAGSSDAEGATAWELQVNSMPVDGGRPIYRPISFSNLPARLRDNAETLIEEVLDYVLNQEDNVSR